MTGNISKISYFAGLDIDKKYRTVYSGSLAAYNAFLIPYLLPGGVDVPHGEQSDTWRESQTELFTENPAAANAEYLSVELTNGDIMFYFVDSVETLDDDLIHLSIMLDEWATYTRKTGVKLKNAVMVEGHADKLPEYINDYAYTAKYTRIQPTSEGGQVPGAFGDIIPAVEQPDGRAYRPLVFITAEHNGIESYVITTNDALTLRQAVEVCAAWGSTTEAEIITGSTWDTVSINATAAYIFLSNMIPDHAAAPLIRLKNTTVNASGYNVPRGRFTWVKTIETPVNQITSAGTYTTQIEAKNYCKGVNTDIRAELQILDGRAAFTLSAFGERVDITQDYSATLYTSEKNARTQSQKAAEMLQNGGKLLSSVAAVAAAVATKQPALLASGALNFGGAAINATRIGEGGANIRQSGNAERTFARYYNDEPVSHCKSGLTTWTTYETNLNEINKSKEKFGLMYPDGIFAETVQSIFAGTQTRSEIFARFDGGYITGIPTGDAEIIENALKNGVIIKKL